MLPVATARAADPVIANHEARSAVGALGGNLVYRRKTEKGKPDVCMRRVGGKLLRASHLPLSSCFPGAMGLDAKGRVVMVFARYRTGMRGIAVPARWYGYDVKADRVRLLEGVPTAPCAPDVVLTWRTRIVYGLSCSSKKRNGLWAKDGKTTRRILASDSDVSGLTLRGGTLAGLRLVGLYDFGVYQLMVDGKPCVRTIVSPWDDFQNKAIFGVWIANGRIIWSGGYPGRDVPQPGAGLFTSNVPSHCTSPGPNGRFDFNPDIALNDFTVDGRHVYYAGKDSIRSHTLPAQPSYAPPANDNFENARSIAIGPYSTQTGVTAWATVQPGETLANVKQTAWYTFTPATSGPLEVDVEGSQRHTGRFGVYSGASLSTLSPVAGPAPTTGPPGYGHVQFDASAGQQYWIDLGSSDPQADFRPFFVTVKKP